MGDKTTLTVQPNTLERFKQLKDTLDSHQDGVPDHTTDSFLSALLDEWEMDTHEIDPERFELREDEVAILASNHKFAHEMADQIGESSGGVDYDDVKNACAAAIREELEGV